MRLLLLLHPDYSFPHRLDEFPLADTLYTWLKQDERRRLMIVANTEIFTDASMRDQIIIKQMRLGHRFQRLGSAWLFQLLLLKWFQSFQPTHIFFDSIDTILLSRTTTICALCMKRLYKLPSYVCCSTHKSYQKAGYFLQKKKHLQIVGIIHTNAFYVKDDKMPDRINIYSLHQAPASLFAPATPDKKENIKNQLTGGCEYFLCSGSFTDKESLIQLLKAFSIFKKRFNNRFVLVLSGISIDNPLLNTILSGYKYRNEVLAIPNHLTPFSSLVMASCYGHIFTPDDIYPYDIAACFASGIPSIAEKSLYTALEDELFLDYDAGSGQDLAEKMMLLYKDESLRSRIIAKGLQYIHQKSQDPERQEVINMLLQNSQL